MTKTLRLTEDEYRAVYAALGQYVENGAQPAAEATEAGKVPDPVLGAGEALLERLDAQMAALAAE